MARLAGKVAIVTGASYEAGIGYAIARHLCLAGASVVFTGTNEQALNERARELSEEGFRVFSAASDVQEEAAWENLIARTIREFGSIDILVNNAGLTRLHPIEDMEIDDWNLVQNVNLTGTMLGCKHVVRAMKKAGNPGSIINIASVGALAGYATGGAYGASKSAVRQLSKIIALEGGPHGIRCNTIFPGMVKTDIFTPLVESDPGLIERRLAAIPMGRFAEPGEIAHCAVFLASDESGYVTGAEFVIDGGFTLA